MKARQGFELWVDAPYDPRVLKGFLLPAAVLYGVLLLLGIRETLALPPAELFAVVALEAGFGLALLGLGAFFHQSRQRLWVSAERRQVVSELVWGSWVIRDVDLPFDDIQKVEPGWPKALKRWLPGGGDRHPLTVVQRRGTKVRLLALASQDEVETVVERLRRVLV